MTCCRPSAKWFSSRPQPTNQTNFFTNGLLESTAAAKDSLDVVSPLLEIIGASYRLSLFITVLPKLCLYYGNVASGHTAIVMVLDGTQVPPQISGIECIRQVSTRKGVESCNILHSHLHAHWIQRHTNDCTEARVYKF